jgi:glycine/D-amino acid oxidase-like deaminating enzyme
VTRPSVSEAAVPYWPTTRDATGYPPLERDAAVDVAIVGAGFTGLWTAIRLLETDPSLRVAVLEMESVGFGASGRNGGFCEASLTHGLANGIAHWPDEASFLRAEGERNLAELVAFVGSHAIDADVEATGTVTLADRPGQVAEFEDWAAEAARYGERLEVIDRAEVQEVVRSPRWVGGLRAGPETNVLVNPLALARGLARVASELGAAIHERTRVTGVERIGGGVRVATAAGPTVRASHVVVATSAYSAWLPRLTPLFVPVYDYVLVSDPLTERQREAIGWRGREGLSDANNQFHYFRLTADGRILWGGYDAIYHFGNGVGPDRDARPATWARLEEHFRDAFPALAPLAFPYRWGGAIDTSSAFTVTFGRQLGGRLVYALGYTGLGVGASRWAAGVVRDMLLRPDSDLLRLRFVRSRPVPFPPEPLRYATVELVRRELDRADRNDGQRGLLLRTLDWLGIGYDS